MRPIKSPTQFVSSLETRLKDATRGGKQVGAPTLQKALKDADVSKLTPRQHEQLRDVFEKVKLTPKARELADRFVGAKKPLEEVLPQVMDRPVKVKMDEPTLPGIGGPFTPPNNGGLVKVKMDEPTLPGIDGPLTPPNNGGLVKVKMDEPTLPGIDGPLTPPNNGGLVKVKMDEPTLPGIDGPLLPPNNGGLVKVKMDEPTLPGIGGPLLPPNNGGLVKVMADDPFRGNS